MADRMDFPATVEEFMEQYKITDTEEVYTNGIELVPIFRMKQWFDRHPSVDVAPVRHGKWKKIGAWGRVYRCNQCGNFLDFDGVNAGRGAANFCPNCMAKMDGKKEG